MLSYKEMQQSNKVVVIMRICLETLHKRKMLFKTNKHDNKTQLL